MAKTGRQSGDDVDALFRLPLGEFVAERKALAARLKKEARATESQDVMSLAKPSISAWTVNQLYWQHRDAFDRLLATGQRFRKSQSSGKVAEMREALEARRESLARLEALATSLLQNTGHNPTLDVIRRIATTLEAVSAYEVLPDGSSPGRMTKDVDPPGFESLASFVATPGIAKRTEAAKPAAPVKASEPRASTRTKTATKESRHEDQRRGSRPANIAAAKTSLANARKVLTAARVKAQNLKATQTKFDAAAKEAEKRRRELEQRFIKAGAAADAASERARTGKIEVDEANRALENAERSVEAASEKLDSLIGAE